MITKDHTSAPIIQMVTIIKMLRTLSNAVLYRYDAKNMYEKREYVELRSDRYIDPSIETINNNMRNTWV
jgi:hypothetical protein